MFWDWSTMMNEKYKILQDFFRDRHNEKLQDFHRIVANNNQFIKSQEQKKKELNSIAQEAIEEFLGNNLLPEHPQKIEDKLANIDIAYWRAFNTDPKFLAIYQSLRDNVVSDCQQHNKENTNIEIRDAIISMFIKNMMNDTFASKVQYDANIPNINTSYCIQLAAYHSNNQNLETLNNQKSNADQALQDEYQFVDFLNKNRSNPCVANALTESIPDYYFNLKDSTGSSLKPKTS